jgi:hypothetical protein
MFFSVVTASRDYKEWPQALRNSLAELHGGTGCGGSSRLAHAKGRADFDLFQPLIQRQLAAGVLPATLLGQIWETRFRGQGRQCISQSNACERS